MWWYIELFLLSGSVVMIYYLGIRIEHLKIDLARYKSIETFIHKNSLNLLCEEYEFEEDLNGHQNVWVWRQMEWHKIGVSHKDDNFIKLNES